MREIKFRIYQNLNAPHEEPDWEVKEYEDIRYEPLCVVEGGLSYHIVQYTGLKDKNGVDIYELCELNNRYIVTYKSPKFVLYEITSGDIIEFNDQDEYEITTEYKPLPQDSKRGAN